MRSSVVHERLANKTLLEQSVALRLSCQCPNITRVRLCVRVGGLF